MKNTFGNSITLTIYGESHGASVGAVIDGLPAGIPVDTNFISKQLELRRPEGAISTARKEKDEFTIESGVFEGKTTGSPLLIRIPNCDTRSSDYKRNLPRPSHADYTAYVKYNGCEDYRGGGHFSGRITAALVAAGGILIPMLNEKGIKIGTHIKKIYNKFDRDFGDISQDIDLLNTKKFAVLDESVESDFTNAILEAKTEGDSVGGVLETAVFGLPCGVGEPWFDSVESMLSHALFSIPAVKGVEFGAGFSITDMKGSSANDQIKNDNGKIVTLTNNNGGLNGGISNGMPIIFRTAVKPTPTIYKEQSTVNLDTNENATLLSNGRHDPCIVQRARVVVDSVTALVLCDLLNQKFGSDGWK